MGRGLLWADGMSMAISSLTHLYLVFRRDPQTPAQSYASGLRWYGVSFNLKAVGI